MDFGGGDGWAMSQDYAIHVLSPQKDRGDISASEIDEHDGTMGHLGELVRDDCRVLAIHLRKHALGLEQYQRRSEPAGAGSQEVFARRLGGVPLQQAVHDDHRVERAFQRRARR
jgi:hypothetical protein